jgi:hypothetical protein
MVVSYQALMDDNPYQSPHTISDDLRTKHPSDGRFWSLVLFLSLLTSFVVLLFWLRGI